MEQRLDDFEKIRLALINTKISMISADHLVSYLSDVLFGCRVTAVLYSELNSEKIYGLEIKKKVNFL